VHPTNYLARARAFLEAGRADLAEQFARRAVQADEENGEAYLLLGILLLSRGDNPGAVRSLARATALRPEDALARENLSRALRHGFPTGVEEGLFSALPGQTTRGELILRDPRLGLDGPQARRWAVLLAVERDTAPARDPKYRREYPRAVYAYVMQERPTRWFRVATIRFQTSADLTLARRTAALIAQLFWIRREYWRAEPDFPQPLETTLWLSRDGRAGGEEWRGEIYLYDVAHARSDEEWVREVTHEYGHVALPGEAIYSSPEPKANGYLGERLLAKWLADNRASAWDGAVDLRRYVARRADPLRRRFLSQGPRSPLRSRRDGEGMEYYIGAVLAWEAAHGPTLLRAALDRTGGGGAESFLRGCQKAVEDGASRRVEVAGEALSSGIAGASDDRGTAWLYLPAGRWRLELETTVESAIVVNWDGRRLVPASAGSRTIYSIRLSASGWHRLELLSGRSAVRRMGLVRTAEGGQREG
jgi:hypothetical protein